MLLPACISSIKNLVGDVAKVIALGAEDAQTVLEVGLLIKDWAQLYDQSHLPRHQQCLIESFSLAAQRGESQLPQDIDRSILSLRINLSYYSPRIAGWQ